MVDNEKVTVTDLETCLSAQNTMRVLQSYFSTDAMRQLIDEAIRSLDTCETLIRSELNKKETL